MKQEPRSKKEYGPFKYLQEVQNTGLRLFMEKGQFLMIGAQRSCHDQFCRAQHKSTLEIYQSTDVISNISKASETEWLV